MCGASATLATGTVLPNYPGKEADIAFVVIAVNAFATLAMILYPLICIALGFSPQTEGVMLGGTIHDVAQVVGAGYAVSEPVGNTAVIVKLFRVFLLLPVVLGIGYWFTRKGRSHGDARVPVPMFAFVFLLLCLVNSFARRRSPRRRLSLCGAQAMAARLLGLGVADRDRRSRPQHVVQSNHQPRLAPYRDRHRHHAGDPRRRHRRTPRHRMTRCRR